MSLSVWLMRFPQPITVQHEHYHENMQPQSRTETSLINNHDHPSII